jgi:hypothetical protein
MFKEFNVIGDQVSYQLHSEDSAWIQTFTGKKFYPLQPKEEDICIEDIAHALSMQCRFTGHSKFHFSIAQHSVYVSYLCDTSDQLHGLLHDGSEAFCADLASPMKRLPQLAGYKTIESGVQQAIYRKFGLTEIEPASVKTADILSLGIEAKSVLGTLHPDWTLPVEPPPFAVVPMQPNEAEAMFLRRFYQLYQGK